MLKKDLEKLYEDCYYENNLLNNEKRIPKFISFSNKLSEIKKLKDNLNNHRLEANEKNLEKLEKLKEEILEISDYFRIKFDTEDTLNQSRIKQSDIDELLSNKGLNRNRVHNHNITKQVYNRYEKYKEVVNNHLNKGGELYDYVISIKSGRGNNERLQEVIDELNEKGLGIISKSKKNSDTSIFTHEMLIVTNSLHAFQIEQSLSNKGASYKSLDKRSVFLMPNPKKILVKEKIEEYGIEEFEIDNISKKSIFALNNDILGFRKEKYINPPRQFAGLTSKGLQFKVQGKDITQQNAYIVKNPLQVKEEDKKTNIKKYKI
tara:strand:+ start:7644 stop:8600 length:957 start_codon:yes stop_codon:yes gene_type:complete